jgi:uncharacterized membrane protein YfcA
MLEQALQLLPSPSTWILYFTCAMLIGMSKTGIQNIGTLAIPLFALLFGAKQSTGIVLILLAMADLVAIIYYRKKLIWKEVLKLLPMSLLGLIIALIFGHYIDDKTFKIVMASCILVGVVIMIWMEHVDELRRNQVTNGKWYAPFFGLLMGFSTMIGNAAGPALSVYLLSRRMDKFTFVATGAWFIMILNYIKIPLQSLVWDNLTLPGIILNIMALPFILLGGFIGIKLVKVLPGESFKKLIMVLVVATCIFMLVY